VPAGARRKAGPAGHRRLTARSAQDPTPPGRLLRRAALPRSRRSLTVLERALLAMTRNAERLQIRKIVGTAVDQGNHVVEFPERAARHEPVLPHPSPHAAPLEAAAQLHRVHPTRRADAAVASANAPTQRAGIRRVVGGHTDGMPATAAVDRAALCARLVQDRLATPAAGSTRGVRKRDLGASGVQFRSTASICARSARLRALFSAFGFNADSRIRAKLRDGRRSEDPAARFPEA